MAKQGGYQLLRYTPSILVVGFSAWKASNWGKSAKIVSTALAGWATKIVVDKILDWAKSDELANAVYVAEEAYRFYTDAPGYVAEHSFSALQTGHAKVQQYIPENYSRNLCVRGLNTTISYGIPVIKFCYLSSAKAYIASHQRNLYGMIQKLKNMTCDEWAEFLLLPYAQDESASPDSNARNDGVLLVLSDAKKSSAAGSLLSFFFCGHGASRAPISGDNREASGGLPRSDYDAISPQEEELFLEGSSDNSQLRLPGLDHR
tara:strand:+ start:389 stop:1171 length:783 start_codon:yes stop_codon:yes gene_type:complete